MSDLTLWERIKIIIAYWLLPWDEPNTLTSLLEARAENDALKRENDVLKEYAAILDYWFNPDKVPVNVKRVIGALRVKCASLLTAEEPQRKEKS